MPRENTVAPDVRNRNIAREAIARAVVCEAALAIDDSQWAWLWNATQSPALDGPVRELANAVAELRALQGENAP